MPAQVRRNVQGWKADGKVDGDAPHARVWSRSTTASSSPPSDDQNATRPPKQVSHPPAKPQVTRSRIPTQPRAASPKNVTKGKRSRRLKFGVDDAQHKLKVTTTVEPTEWGKTQTLATKTPHIAAGSTTVSRRRPEVFRSPGGTDYIITPGRHKIEMTEFLPLFDAQVAEIQCPRMRGVAFYAENMYRQWLEAERDLDNGVFLLSFPHSNPLEKFRQMAIQTVFNYAVENALHEKTVHLTVLNINRILHYWHTRGATQSLSSETFACTVMSALRSAIKSDESYEKSEKFRIDPDHVWRSSPFLMEIRHVDQSVKRLNAIEANSISILAHPANPPLSPEFLERYVAVGNWPKNAQDYQELGSFLLGMALFANGEQNPLQGIPHSKLAAAALALAVKVINTDSGFEKFEYWPERLVFYTGYTIEELKSGIRGLAWLLRNKPETSSILEKYYTKWGQFDWN